MQHPRRQFLHLAAAATWLSAFPMTALAQLYPSKPLRILVGFPAGGLTDITARLIGQRLSSRSGQQFVVENRPGAVTNIATEAVVNSPADGYTLLMATSMNAINATVFGKLRFNFMRDIVPVASVADAAFVLEVNPSIPAKTVPEFVAYAKANPGKLSLASAGIGSPEHVAGELFMMMTGIDMLHVPYRGSAPAVTDLVGGHVQVYFGPIAPSIEHIKAGQLRALAVTTTARSSALPDTPSIAEHLPSFDVSAWQGIGAPKGTPASVIESLNQQINAVLLGADLRVRLNELGLRPIPGSPADFARLIAQDTEKWAKVVMTAGIKAD